MKNKQGYFIINNKKHIIDENQTEMQFDPFPPYYHYHQQITELKLNNKIKSLSCTSNKIKKLILPNSLEFLRCYNNKIKELQLNSNLRYLACDMGVKLHNIPKNCEIHYYR